MAKNFFKILIAQQQKIFDKYGHIYLYEVAVGFQFKESHDEEKWNSMLLHIMHCMI